MDAIERFYKGPDPAGRVVEFRGLLRRFLDVCNAMSYAHSKGVLHRDLKPDNILLGPYGETLVVDWGLAKAAGHADPASATDGEQVRLNLSGSELSPTMAGGALGTPEYAPPEQMTGDLPRVGPRSDVYGLGAVLYCLSTGRAPFSRKGIDFGVLIQKIESGDFPPPRQVRAEIDRPLEAVCLKAMARKPADRYESAVALAKDVENYLADEPVSAFPEPWRVRARRWMKRHRTAVTATIAALVVALVGLGAIAAVQTKARNDLTAKNKDLDEQRRRAEDREAQAIAAVKQFGDAITNEPELKKTPALDGLRKRLLKEPLAFFRDLGDRLRADRDTRPESLARLADASFALGHLTNEIGNKKNALIAYRESLAIRQKLADADPTVTEFQNTLAASLLNIGNLLSDTGKPTEALKAYESALAIRQKLADADPTVTEFQNTLAASHNNIGNVLRDIGKPAEATKAHESARAIRQKLAQEHPEFPQFACRLGGTLNNLAMIDVDAKRFEEAQVRLRQAVQWQRKALIYSPANPIYRKFLDNHLTGLILASRGLDDPEGVAEAERELAKLRDSDPMMAALDTRLSAIIKGDQEPRDESDRLRLAQRAYNKALHATAARLWADALAVNPKLGDDRQNSVRYDAACSTALASSGKDRGERKLDETARAKLRAQALGWLKAELAAWERVAKTAAPGNRELVAQTLAHWKEDADLAGVREPSALDKLPEAERKEWQALWADVDKVLARVGKP